MLLNMTIGIPEIPIGIPNIGIRNTSCVNYISFNRILNPELNHLLAVEFRGVAPDIPAPHRGTKHEDVARPYYK